MFNKLINWWQNLPPIGKFLSSFITLIVLFYAFYYSPLYELYIMTALLNFQANLASILLSIMGYKTSIEGDLIQGDEFRGQHQGGCDGIEASALYAIAVISLPLVARKYKISGLIVGLSILFVLNIIRIAGLYLAGIHWPAFFEFFHLHGGVIAFLLISVIMWLIWVQWVMKKTAHNND
ncbi:MAG: exosortase/archaeosortase family protein [Saprospiraceae bacterium]|nr:exosortase/archaeosortase family protein [Candidatus Vicinibacter affinis]